jgi:hypothetical protein
MTISELGSLGEFISSIAVIITLIYLAIQIRQSKHGMEVNTQALLGASEVSGNENAIAQQASMYSDESLVDVFVRGSRSLADLPPHDWVRFNGFCHASLQLHQVTYMQWRRGLLEDDYWYFCIRYMSDQLFRLQGVQEWWQNAGHLYLEDYRAVIDRAIEQEAWSTPAEFCEREKARA